SLLKVGSAGLSGDPARVSGLAISLLLQVAVLHSPDEVTIAAAVPGRDRAEWAWLGWLPHAVSERSPIGLPMVAHGAGAGGRRPATGGREGCWVADEAATAVALDVATALAGVRDAGALAGRADVPARVGLFSALGLDGGGATGVEERWTRRDALLRAPLGVGPGAEVLEIGLRRDGPHALIGGMTGAGKSELLQTLVASLATHHS